MSSPATQLRPGDHIKITGGKYRGESGVVHHITNFFVFFTYHGMPSMVPAQASKRFVVRAEVERTTSALPALAPPRPGLANEVDVLATLLIECLRVSPRGHHTAVVDRIRSESTRMNPE